MILLKEGVGVDTNESKDDKFCPNCGRELIPNSTGGRYCPYCGYLEKCKKELK